MVSCIFVWSSWHLFDATVYFVGNVSFLALRQHIGQHLVAAHEGGRCSAIFTWQLRIKKGPQFEVSTVHLSLFHTMQKWEVNNLNLDSRPRPKWLWSPVIIDIYSKVLLVMKVQMKKHSFALWIARIQLRSKHVWDHSLVKRLACFSSPHVKRFELLRLS